MSCCEHESNLALDELAHLVQRMIERVEAALEPGPRRGQFLLWADDVQQLGWARIVCELAQAKELAECR